MRPGGGSPRKSSVVITGKNTLEIMTVSTNVQKKLFMSKEVKSDFTN